MAGIPGQPGTKPSNVPKPVPGKSMLDSYAQSEQAQAQSAGSGSALDSYADSGQAPSPDQMAPQGAQFPGSDAIRWGADAIPAGLATLGGIAATPLGPAGQAAVAGVMGASGNGYKYLIHAALGDQPPSPEQAWQEAKSTATKEAENQLIGYGLGKAFQAVGVVGKAAARTNAGTAAIEKVSEIAAKPIAAMKDVFEGFKKEAMKPVTDFMVNKVSPLLPEQAGDAVKQMFSGDISAKFGKFVNAYSNLDAVTKGLPIEEGAKTEFVTGMKKMAENLGGDDRRVVTGLIRDFEKTGNGAAFDNMIGQLKDKITMAYGEGAAQRGGLLKEIRNQAEHFLDGQVEKLAGRIQNGKTTEQELGLLQQLMQKQGVAETDVLKHAKSIAGDYAKDKKAVSAGYAKFKSFLEDVGEQTKVNATTRSPMQFLKAINEVPSEQLVEKMFQPKNAAALRAMQEQTPQVYDQVVKSKMRQLTDQAMENGTLDLGKLHKLINKVPEGTRGLLLDKGQMAKLESVAKGPALATIKAFETAFNSKAVKIAKGLSLGLPGAIGKTAGAINNSKAASGIVRRNVGNALTSAFGSQQPAPDEGQ